VLRFSGRQRHDARSRHTALMTQARSTLIPPGHAVFVHVTTRCVRRAWLFGYDRFSNRRFDHRCGLIESRVRELAEVYAVGVYAFACWRLGERRCWGDFWRYGAWVCWRDFGLSFTAGITDRLSVEWGFFGATAPGCAGGIPAWGGVVAVDVGCGAGFGACGGRLRPAPGVFGLSLTLTGH
jgi:hypothetical protein